MHVNDMFDRWYDLEDRDQSTLTEKEVQELEFLKETCTRIIDEYESR